MGKATEAIQERVENIINTIRPKGVVNQNTVEKMERDLENMIISWPTMGDYIYAYIYDHSLELQKEYPKGYETVPEEFMWKCIKKAFADNGLRGKGTIERNKEGKLKTTPLSHIRQQLSKKCFNIDRNVAFLLALGLNMSVDDTSDLLTKMLLQEDFNPKDPREAVFFWAIKNHEGFANTFEAVCEWEDYYNKIIIKDEYNHMARRFSDNSGTLLMVNEMLDMTEEAFKEHLHMLKADQPRSTAAKAVFNKLFSWLPQGEYPDIPSSKNDPDKSIYDTVEHKVPNFRKFIVECAEQYSGKIMDKKILKELFGNNKSKDNKVIDITKKYVYDRMEGTVNASRKDILLMHAVIFLDELSEHGFVVEPEDLQYVFEDRTDSDLISCRMQPFYIRNPFDYFLLICMLKKNKDDRDMLGYFFKSWCTALGMI